MTRAATTLADPCTGAPRRDFLLGLRHGQRVGAQVPSWCSGHGWTAGCSQRAGPPGQLTALSDQTAAEGTGETTGEVLTYDQALRHLESAGEALDVLFGGGRAHPRVHIGVRRPWPLADTLEALRVTSAFDQPSSAMPCGSRWPPQPAPPCP